MTWFETRFQCSKPFYNDFRSIWYCYKNLGIQSCIGYQFNPATYNGVKICIKLDSIHSLDFLCFIAHLLSPVNHLWVSSQLLFFLEKEHQLKEHFSTPSFIFPRVFRRMKLLNYVPISQYYSAHLNMSNQYLGGGGLLT